MERPLELRPFGFSAHQRDGGFKGLRHGLRLQVQQPLVKPAGRRPRLDDLRVVAYRGEPTDTKAVFMSGVNERDHTPAFVVRGEPVASAAVDGMGNFTLHAPVPVQAPLQLRNS